MLAIVVPIALISLFAYLVVKRHKVNREWEKQMRQPDYRDSMAIFKRENGNS